MADQKEQQMKQEIRRFLAKKQYYEILGVARSATDSEIKKAYRTLALRFHPDKNQAEGSKDVFKKVSNAYSTLIDAQKRRRYDQVGVEEDRPQQQYRHQAGAQGEDYEFQDFQDIFQAFFGGGHRQRQPQRQNRGFQFNRQGQQGQQQQGGFSFYYIFIVFFVVYTILPMLQSSPNYSSASSYEHRIRRATSRLNVEYFVNQKFMEESRNKEYLRKAEMQMDKEFLVQLEQKCEYVKNQKRNLEVYAYQHREGRQRQNYLNRAKNIDTTPCRYLQQLSQAQEDYVRELTYMRY